MTAKTDAKALDDTDLDAAQGAGGAANGILIAANTENEVAGITADQKTIIGGFKSMTGMSSETE